jgi:hypothetical protein
LFIEQVLAWSFFYGFLALYMVVGAGLVRSAFTWNAALAASLAVILIAGLALALLWPRFIRRRQRG